MPLVFTSCPLTGLSPMSSSVHWQKIVPTWKRSHQGLRIILINLAVISGKRHCCRIGQMTVFASLSSTRPLQCSSIISWQEYKISLQLSNLARGKRSVDLGVNCPFKCPANLELSLLCVGLSNTHYTDTYHDWLWNLIILYFLCVSL